MDEEPPDADDVIERLSPDMISEEDFGKKLDHSHLESNPNVDHLFQEDRAINDTSLDSLFDEDRESFHRDLQEEVQKALSQPVMSKASLYRMKMNEPTESDLEAEIAKQKTVEEIWDDPLADNEEKRNRKSIIIMLVFIGLISIASVWALWKSTNDERGNDHDLIEQEIVKKKKEQEMLLIESEIREITEVINQYLSAITIDQKCESIYQNKLLHDEIKKHYENNNGVKPHSGFMVDKVHPISVGDEDIWEVLIKNANGVSKEGEIYLVRKDSDETFKVDWKADVGFQDNSVNNFTASRSKQATTFRFIVEPMLHIPTFNWGFKEKDYQVLRLLIPNTEHVFWGYIRRGSVEQSTIQTFMDRDAKNITVDDLVRRHEFLLAIKFLEDSPVENDQYVLIDKVISRKWLTSNEELLHE